MAAEACPSRRLMVRMFIPAAMNWETWACSMVCKRRGSSPSHDLAALIANLRASTASARALRGPSLLNLFGDARSVSDERCATK
jgi:hypothetical protein